MPLEVVSLEERARLRALPPTREVHARLQAQLAFLDEVQSEPPPQRRAPPRSARVLCWNVERGRHLEAQARLLAAQAADAILLSELDWGMARSGQKHTARELAQRLDCGFVYGVEFLELDLGDPAERAAYAGEQNEVGYHGAAILSPHPLERPQLLRLDAGGDWFDGTRDERRIGGRMAVLATLRLEGQAVTLASVHLESHSDPPHRARQLARLLDGIERYAPDAPVLIGGDLNTSSLAREQLGDRERLRGALREDAQRLRNPVPHEPLFALAEQHGYEWRGCNLAESTHRLDDPPRRSGAQLDWFFARGLETHDPAVLDAFDRESGQTLSDHEALALSARLLRPPRR